MWSLAFDVLTCRLADELKSRRELEEQRQLVGLRHHRSQLYKGYKMLTKLTVG